MYFNNGLCHLTLTFKFIVHLVCVVTCACVLVGIMIAYGTKSMNWLCFLHI